MLKNIEQMKIADQILVEKKKQRNREMVAEVEKANKTALLRKAEKMQQEKDEDLKIVEHEARKRAEVE